MMTRSEGCNPLVSLSSRCSGRQAVISWPRAYNSSSEPKELLMMSGIFRNPCPMRFSESWKMACSARPSTSSASSACSMASAMAFWATLISPRSRPCCARCERSARCWPLGNSVDERREIRHTANRFYLFAAVEFLDQRDHVDRASGFLQIAHARINPAMRVEREIIGSEMLGGLVVERVVEQDCAQDRALGFHADGKSAFRL